MPSMIRLCRMNGTRFSARQASCARKRYIGKAVESQS
jgi:hypothetical protein